MRRQKLLSVAAASVLAVSLAACGGEDDDTVAGGSDETPSADESAESADEPTEEVTEETEEPAEETEDSEAPAPGGTGEETAPGTQLAFGDPAVVPFEYANESGTLQITVNAIREGSPSDLADVDNTEGMTPYYIDFDVEAVDGAENLSYASVSLQPQTAEGTRGGLIIMGSGIGGCESETAPGDWDGSSFSTCQVTFAPAPITQVLYDETDAYNTVDGEPIVWTE